MKAARATEHLNDLRKLISDFLGKDPYTITKKDDEKRQLYIVRIESNPATPRIPILIGEFAYALRSALDQLVWQLALLSGHRPGNKSAFPIHHSDANTDRQRFMLATWNVPAEAIEIIKRFQPYTRGNAYKSHPLWQLNKLCNLDKHQTIGVNSTSINFATTGPPHNILQRHFDQGVELAIPLAAKADVTFEPEIPTLVFGKPIHAPGSDFELTQEEVTEIHRFVRDEVIPSFSRFFPDCERLSFLP